MGTADAPSPAPFTKTFEYDERNRQSLHVSFEGVVTESVYSLATGRLVEQWFFDNLTQYNNGLGLPSETWTYTHDVRSRVIDVTQTKGVTSRSTVTSFNG